MSAPRLPLSSRPAFLPDEVARREFANVFRGYDPSEVRTFLNQLADQIADSGDRLAEAQRMLSEAQNRVKNPELDEEMVTKLLGEQTAQILRSAREAANEMRAKAEQEVSRSLREAHEVTSQMRSEAETLLSERTEEAEKAAGTIRSEANESAAATRREADDEVAKLRADVAAEVELLREQVAQEVAEARERARQEGHDLVERAREESRELVRRTEERQVEMLDTLIRKRKIALAQLEELRAGRQRLLKAYKMVRGTLDEVTAELERVDEEARNAGELAGQRAAASAELDNEDLGVAIEIERLELEDDVPTEVIDLVEGVTQPGDDRHNGADNGESTDVLDLDEEQSDDHPMSEFGIGTPSTDGEEPRQSAFLLGEVGGGVATEIDHAVRLRRDTVVGKAQGQAVRRLNRAFQDDQDALIVRLRSAASQDDIANVLGTSEDQASLYLRAIVKLFREVIRNGANSIEGSAVDRAVLDQMGTTAARGMVNELVEDIRGQVQPVVAELIASERHTDAGLVQTEIGHAFRSLRGEYVDNLVEDRLGGAFEQGVALASQA